MNTTKHPMVTDHVIFVDEPINKPINSFLLEKLKPLTSYISEPNNTANFFCQIDDFSITGSQALEFITLADRFKYDITIGKTDRLTINFWKR